MLSDLVIYSLKKAVKIHSLNMFITYYALALQVKGYSFIASVLYNQLYKYMFSTISFFHSQTNKNRNVFCHALQWPFLQVNCIPFDIAQSLR